MASVYWLRVLVVTFYYVGGAIGFAYLIAGKCKPKTYLFEYIMFLLGGIGIGAGSHRLFSHRSYKVNRGLKIFILMCHTLAGQFNMVLWCAIHRVHHKFTDTEKDPTNIKRGFFFAHITWFFKHTPECRKELDRIDMSDLTGDRDIMLQKNYYPILCSIFCIGLPTLIPVYFWNESLQIAFWTNAFRCLLNWNQMSFANSFMHIYGKQPYDKNMTAGENVLSIIFTHGEGYHNYHHVFPFDYKAAELGGFTDFNISSWLIDVWVKLGWAYDLKKVSKAMIERRMKRTGDGTSWLSDDESHKNSVWGYGDEGMNEDDKRELHYSERKTSSRISYEQATD